MVPYSHGGPVARVYSHDAMNRETEGNCAGHRLDRRHRRSVRAGVRRARLQRDDERNGRACGDRAAARRDRGGARCRCRVPRRRRGRARRDRSHGARGRTAIRRRRHPGQQRGRAALRQDRGFSRRQMGPRDGRRSIGGVSHHTPHHPPHEGARLGPHHQHVIDTRPHGGAQPRGLRDREARVDRTSRAPSRWKPRKAASRSTR